MKNEKINVRQDFIKYLKANCVDYYDDFSEMGFKYIVKYIESLHEQLDKYKKGHKRYEIVRKMNPQTFVEIYKINIKTGKHFDQIIDEIGEK